MKTPQRLLPPRVVAVSVIANVVIATGLAQTPSVWNNPLGGDITTPANWTGPVVSATQAGAFTLNNTYNVNVLNDLTVLDLGVNAGNVSLVVAAGKTLGFNGTLQVASGAVGILSGPGAIGPVRLSISGTLHADTVVNLATGTSTANGGLVIGKSSAGTLNVANGAVLNATAGILVGDGGTRGTINQTGGTVRADAGITFG
ncbi:MAG: hypothetical protein EOP84_25380, partial [Verrucomicrobiaceae bacterium]